MKQNNCIKRNVKIDIIKGIAIFLVLYGHYIQYTVLNIDYFENSMFKFIYSFHMPLFALVSGYLFYDTLKRKNIKEVIYSRIKGLMYPIIVWTTINWAISSIAKRTIDLIEWWKLFTGTYLWFLWSIFAVSICLALIIKLLPNKSHIIAIVLGFFIMYLFPNSEMNIYIYPFFIIGYYFKKNKEKLNSYLDNKHEILVIIIFIILLLLFKKECYIYTTGITIWKSELHILQHIAIDIYRYTIGLFGSVSIIIIINKIFEKIPLIIKKKLINLGEYSLQIYILQCLFFRIYTDICKKSFWNINKNILTDNMIVYNFIVTPILAIVTLFCITIIIKYINKNKKISKILFGR